MNCLGRLGDTSEAGVPDAISWVSFIPLFLSFVAVLVSGVALWRTHFSRGELVFAPGMAGLSITHWTNEGRTWHTPDIVITTSIANTGARPIVVQGLRVRVEYPELPIPNAHEIWDFNFELDLDTELVSGPGRSAIGAKSGTGTPFIVLSKANVEKRFVCWTRWDKPVVQALKFTLEVKTGRSPKWTAVESWSYKLTSQNWVDLTSTGMIIWLLPVGQESARYTRITSPEDLHKYTGTAEPLPTKSTHTPPSFVVHEGSADRGLSG